MIASAPSGISDSTPDRLTLLHLAPHPDDEVMGGPAIMLELQAGGHRIVNVACGLGRPEDRERREAEARESCRRTGFELVVPARPAEIGSGGDLPAPQAQRAGLGCWASAPREAGASSRNWRPRLCSRTETGVSGKGGSWPPPSRWPSPPGRRSPRG